MWTWNKRNLPRRNYNEDEDDSDLEEYNSTEDSPGFTSPRRPRQAGSPIARQNNTVHTDNLLADATDRLAENYTMTFEDENGTDEAGALGNGLRSLEKLEWNDKDLPFFFNRVETRMGSAGVKKNFTKFQILSEILPSRVQNQVKGILRKGENDFPNKDAYKVLKKEILRIFGPKLEDAVQRAMTRVLTGLPSELARDLVDDLCKHELNCECCPAMISYLWKKQLPSQVRAGIAHYEFNKTNFEVMIQLADKIFADTNQSAVNAFSVAAVTTNPTVNLNETQPGIPYPVPEVAAIRGASRGRGRGGRGRGRGRGRGAGGAAAATSQTRHTGTKHPDLPAGDWKGCGMHFKFGKGAFFCSDPSICPWKDVYTSKPAKQ